MGDSGVYLVTRLLNEKFRAEGFNTITFGEPPNIDLAKQSVYPMMHITLVNRSMSYASEVVTCELIFADSVYEGKPLDSRTVNNQMSNVSNTEDIFHDLGYRINRAYQAFYKDLNTIMQVPDSITINADYRMLQNKLAIYEATFEITILGGDVC